MLDHLAAFGADLRAAGVPVSTVELSDAAVALTEVGMQQRDRCRSAMRTTMVKRSEQVGLFDELFEARFGRKHRQASAVPMTAEDLRDLLALGDLDDDAVSDAIREAVAQFAGLVPGRFLGVDYHLRRTLRQLMSEDALAISKEADFDARLESFDERARVSRIEELLSQEIHRAAVNERGSDWARTEAVDRLPQHLDFLRVNPDEVVELRRSVDALARKLAARLQRKKHTGSFGRLNMAATVRSSMSTGGVPFNPVFRRPRPHRPDVMVLADVSGSVSTFARFTLRLVHALAGQFSQLRTFVFVDEVDEATGWFGESNDFDTAMARVNGRARTTGNAGHSDYGHVLNSFAARWGNEVRSTTTVLVLGDARNNYHQVQSSALREVASKARRTYWFNPEPRSYWNTADSVMAHYEPHCSGVFECRNLHQLAKAVEVLS